MTTGEIIKELATCKNYLEFRITVDDATIDFIKDYMKRDYELFKEREENYQELLKLFK